MSVEQLKDMMEKSQSIVFFGGAGTSTESNIPDFRSKDGLYSDDQEYSYPPEVILSRSFFDSNPRVFYDFYKSKLIYEDAKPNDAHYALTELEERGKLKAIITQNIDGLHQMAGSKNILELHGSLHRNYCIQCGKEFKLDYMIHSEELISKCDVCHSIVRPDVVLYEESLNMEVLEAAIAYITKADMLIVGGTSLAVYPAAGLINYYNGNRLVLINKTATPYDNRADLVINDSIGKVLKSII